MSGRKRLFFLILIMTCVSLIVGGIAMYVLYRAAIEQTRERLAVTAQSQARLIEAMARFDADYSADYPEGSEAATLLQIRDAHEHYQWFGETGEFTLGRREDKDIVFVLSHRHLDLAELKPIPFDLKLAEPMRRAISGQSGTLVGLDYRGAVVVAAYEPVAELNLGIVAKIDLAEVRAPFVRASLLSLGAGVIVVVFGSLLFLRVSNPMIRRLHELFQQTQQELETAVRHDRCLAWMSRQHRREEQSTCRTGRKDHPSPSRQRGHHGPAFFSKIPSLRASVDRRISPQRHVEHHHDCETDHQAQSLRYVVQRSAIRRVCHFDIVRSTMFGRAASAQSVQQRRQMPNRKKHKRPATLNLSTLARGLPQVLKQRKNSKAENSNIFRMTCAVQRGAAGILDGTAQALKDIEAVALFCPSQ